MPIYKSKNGTYYFRIYVKVNGRAKQVNRKGFRTRSECAEALRKFDLEQEGITKKEQELARTISTIKFKDKADEFFKEQEKFLKQTTLIQYRYYFDKHCISYFGSKPIATISSNQIKEWQSHMMKLTSNRHTNKIFKILSKYFNFLCDFYGLEKNPCNVIHNLRYTNSEIKQVEKQIKVIEQEDYQAFWNVLPTLQAKVIFDILYKCGLRINELRGLLWEDVNLESATIQVNKQCVYIDGVNTLVTPKSKTSNRIINLPKSLLNELETYLNSIDYTLDGKFYVCGNSVPISEETINRWKNTAVKESSILNFTLHELRHSFGSNMIKNGFDIKYVSEQMGHESIGVTMKVYHHLLKSVEEEQRKKYYESF